MLPQSQFQSQPTSHRLHTLLVLVVIILTLGILGLAVYVGSLRSQISEGQLNVSPESKDQKIVNFMSDFINLVLRAPGEVDFETRLKLENEVRDTGDEEIIAAWKAFTDAKSEQEAQDRVIDLLALLTGKLKTP